MGFIADLMGFYGDFMGFIADLMVFNGDLSSGKLTEPWKMMIIL